MNEKIYWGGVILPLTGENRKAEALCVKDGIIKDLGSRDELMKRYPKAESICLEGHTLMPSFIDPHSHFTSLAATESLCSLEGCRSIDEIIERLRAYAEKLGKKEGDFVTGFGYDNNLLPGRKNPDRHDLDKLAGFKVLVSHKSGHMGVLNTAGLAALGIDRNTIAPDGGRIAKDDSGEPTGYLEETAFTGLTERMPRPGVEEGLKSLKLAEDIYFSYGITTVQDGISKEKEVELLKAAEEKDTLDIDVVSYVDMRSYADLLDKARMSYHNRVRFGGWKIFLDGSPQGRTAWMKHPYLGAEDGYSGYPIYKDEEVEAFIKRAMDEEVQILAHSNGDAAAEQYIRCFEHVSSLYSEEERKRKLEKVAPVLIHAQLLEPEQMPRMKALNMTASFFVSHIKHWGDIHISNFGYERAKWISPVKSAVRNGILYTFHEDTPVIMPDMLEAMDAACERVTPNGVELEKSEKVTRYEALMAVTVNGAKQYHEEDTKGTLEIGKRADMVILSDNPITAPSLKNVEILETIKDGKTVYKK